MKKHFWIEAILSLFLFALLSNAHAIECNAESPNLKSQGDKYYDIEGAKPLTSSQKRSISRLFSKFDGERLEGKGTFTECIGAERIAREVSRHEMLEGEVSENTAGQITLRLEAYQTGNKTSRLETLRYFGNNNPHHISELTSNKLLVYTKLRTNKIFIEDITEFTFKGNSITIVTTRYIGGYFAYQYIKHLHL